MNGLVYKNAVNQELGEKRVVSVTKDYRPGGTVWYMVVNVQGLKTDAEATQMVEKAYDAMKRRVGSRVSVKSKGVTQETADRLKPQMNA